MDNRVNIAVVVGVILTLGFAVTLTQIGNQGISQDEQVFNIEKTVNVIGTATKSVEPDTLIIEFGVETVAGTAKQSLEQNSEKLSANSLMILAMAPGDWSYSPNSLGNPALG